MKTIHSVIELRAEINAHKRAGRTVAFVPTMGALHEGHLTLVRRARTLADIVVVSIFVNPLQFGASEDLAAYPRPKEADEQKLIQEKTDILFMPEVKEMYPAGMAAQTLVVVPTELASVHCGEFRPGHFDGVATVVTKLFGMVQPDRAVFGQKDYQQLVIIQRIVRDLCLPVTIVDQPTCREVDGLAMSSRNRYLTAAERPQAAELYRVLETTRTAILEDTAPFAALEEQAWARLSAVGFRPQYFRICSQQDLQPARHDECNIVILVAANLGTTRLIDNIAFSRPECS